MTSFFMTIVMFTLSLTIYKMFANQNSKSLTLKMKLREKEKRDQRHSTENVGFFNGDIFQKFNYLAKIGYAKGYGRINTHVTHSQRQGC